MAFFILFIRLPIQNFVPEMTPFNNTSIEAFGQHWLLSNARCLYWIEQETLLIADLHIGKTRHFRKNGIAVPQETDIRDMKRLRAVIEQYQPGRIILLGDIFHSEDVADDEGFELMLYETRGIEWILIIGNHDPQGTEKYEHLPIRVLEKNFVQESFVFTHHPDERDDRITFCGHIHPAVEMQGKGSQSLKLPCFHWGPKQVVLPAFSRFTGKGMMRAHSEDRIFVITDNEVIEADKMIV